MALMAIFPVLVVNNLTYFIPALETSGGDSFFGVIAHVRWLIAALMIATALAVNLSGARGVGRTARIGAAVVAIANSPSQGDVATLILNDLQGAWLLGLSIVVLNFSGYDTVSTFAGEVDEPQRNYPRAITGALLLTFVAHLFPLVAGLSITTDSTV